MERRNYATILLLVFGIVEVYSSAIDYESQDRFAPIEAPANLFENQLYLDPVATNVERVKRGIDGKPFQRNNRLPTNSVSSGGRPSRTTTTPNPLTEKQLGEQAVKQFQDRIQEYLNQGYDRKTAIDRTITQHRDLAIQVLSYGTKPRI